MILLTVTLVSACVNHTIIRGSKPDEETVAELETGMSKKDVLKAIGSPSVIPPFCDNKVWLYIGSKMTQKAFYDPKEESRQVIVLTFDFLDRVKEIETKDLPEGMKVAYSTDKTPTLGQSFGVIKQIIGNIGRFNVDNK